MLNPGVACSGSLNPHPHPPLLRPRLKTPSLDHLRIGEVFTNRDARAFAGRSKSKSGGSSSGRIEGDSKTRRQMKQNARRKSMKMAESFFYRLKNPNKIHADNFTEDQLNLIGLGYDRLVRFMEKDDPNLRHPYDWYKYGEFGPYSWRGVVVGDPVPGKISDECVTLYSEVKNIEEGEKSDRYEMEVDFGERMKQLNEEVGFKYYWVFVRHPRWRVSEKPWEQWTLACEVVVEAGEKRVDKWSLMGRLGNKARKLITQCAAWVRPDIVYVKRPVYQCRFEPQEMFFEELYPYLDPETERNFMVKLEDESGGVEWCTYYEGLCRIVRVSQKAYVDDVVNAYEKMSDEKKSRCMGFLLQNHPMHLLHPYTVEWKAKLEEMELGCDGLDEDDGEVVYGKEGNEFVEWVEDDGEDDLVMEDGGEHEGESGYEDEDGDGDGDDEREEEQYWEEKLRNAANSSEEMETLARRSVEMTTKLYRKQLSGMEREDIGENGDETALRGLRTKVSPEEWKIAGIGRWRKRIKKSKIPPEVFLPAAVRPFNYRNLVKEIVLLRHGILDGDLSRKND